MVNADEIIFENQDNYLKQTYRNRCYIYGANGKQLLTIPVIHPKNQSNKTKDIRIDHSTNWQKLHIRSMQSAYRSSPFYEFYEDDMLVVFQKKHKFLIDLNIDTFQFIYDNLENPLRYGKTRDFEANIPKNLDFRFLVHAKEHRESNLKEYTQVFDDKHGFISNLSILDLLFNEGPNTLEYLENQAISF